MHNELSEDLLVIISMQEDEPIESRKAFDEFHRRFREYVWQISYTLARGISNPNTELVAQDIFNDTFRDVFYNFESKGYFDSSKCQDIDKGIKAWLSGIARNHLKRYISVLASSSNISHLDNYPDVEFFDMGETDTKENDSPRLLLLKRALDRLSKRDREVLLISVQFEEQGRLPKEIRQSLCNAYGVMPATLRQIKKRAREKVEKFIKEYAISSQVKIKNNVR